MPRGKQRRREQNRRGNHPEPAAGGLPFGGGSLRRLFRLKAGAQDGLQRLPEFLRAAVTVSVLKGACFPDGAVQRGGQIFDRRHGFAVHAAGFRFVSVPAAVQAGFFEEGERPAVGDPVQNHAQGIEIRPVAFLKVGTGKEAALDLWRGKAVPRGELPAGQAFPCGFQRAGHAEVAQLVSAQRGHKNVFRLDIPVNDLPAAADLQPAAEIDSQPDQRFLVIAPDIQIHQQRGQKLHADQVVQNSILRALHNLIVIDAHQIALALQGLHDLDFPAEVGPRFLKEGLCLLGTGPRGAAVLREDADHLDGGRALSAGVLPHGAVDLAVCACADDAVQLPLGPDLRDNIIDRFHARPPCRIAR